MAYKVEVNRLTKTARLVYYATRQRDNIGRRHTEGRRILLVEQTREGLPGLWDYHATKGWRVSRA